MRKEFYLYLDESGDFTNDRETAGKRNWSPSVIGGVLTENADLPSKAKAIFSKHPFHGTDESPDAVFEKFQAIEQLPLRFVFFSNQERIKVINNNLTYQNIIAEGIVQLMVKLMAMHGDIKLNIKIATRIIIGDNEKKESNKKYENVKLDEYVLRIKERLIMMGERQHIPDSIWNVTLGSAREQPDLMMADVVCNTYLTRKRKFMDKKYDQIRAVYHDQDRTWVFSVFQNTVLQLFRNAMSEGRIGEAITILCQSDKKQMIEQNLAEVEERLRTISGEELQVQYRFISALVEYYINVERNYSRSILLLNNILTCVIPMLEEIGRQTNMVENLRIDLNFYLLTAYTHSGNIEKSMECEQICDAMLNEDSNSLERIDYRIRYRNRKIINLINQFDFEGAGTECRELIETCEEIKQLSNRIAGSEQTYLELGKAYSNQVQIISFLLRQKPELYPEAVILSDKAIREMRGDLRQYQYRAVLETEAGKYDRALLSLLVAAEVLSEDEVDFAREITKQDQELLDRFWQQMHDRIESHEYIIEGYVRLMAEGKAGGWEFADTMYAYFKDTVIYRELQKPIHDFRHPYELIYWKLAFYLAQDRKKWREAVNNYNKALEICYKEQSELTLTYIGFAVELERLAFILKCGVAVGNYKTELNRRFEELENQETSESMKRLFKALNIKSNDWNHYYDMSRKVTY